ncbi:MAG: hypothetical protein JNL87_20790 [Burkholderiaceae bacterium]|nr:hypothetical protein [Burkholderiaceae bacterium]
MPRRPAAGPALPSAAAGGRRALLAPALSLLAACAGAPTARLTPGQTEADMLAVMGQPTGRYPLAGAAQRVEYATGPNGKRTWMVDLDATGRVRSVEQVLKPENFRKVRHAMPVQDLLLLLGRPSEKSRERGDRETWSWRYENHEGLWARVTVAYGQVFGDMVLTSDPQNDPLL